MDIEPDADHEKGRTTKVSLAAQVVATPPHLFYFYFSYMHII
jgi:hypothetical protein